MQKDIDQITKPLAVDMDGTLIKTDMLFESANSFIVRHPLKLISILGWLKKGRCHLKAQLAKNSQVDVTTLPYNTQLISFLEKQKLLGRKIILITASHRVLAEKIAKHLGLFNEVLATEGENNLKSESKRDLLVARFGNNGFDYVGNSTADLPVWKSAHKAYVVSSSPALIEKVRSIGNLNKILSNERTPLGKTLLHAIRVHQWVKNLLLFIPALAAHQMGNMNNMLDLIIAFILFCLTASSVYLLNDLIDIPNDRSHRSKYLRPFASGNLSLLVGWILWPTLFVLAGIIAMYMLPRLFCMVLATYFALTLAYSLKLKQIAIIDVIILAILYTIRILAGAVAIGIPLSFWLLALSTFMFLSLAFIKRFSELKSACEIGIKTPIKGRGYTHHDLQIVSSMGIGAGYLAVLVLALYIQDPHTNELYHSSKFIWLACPLLLYWISRAWLIADRGQMHEDPIIFAIKDRISWIIGACFFGVFCLAMIEG